MEDAFGTSHKGAPIQTGVGTPKNAAKEDMLKPMIQGNQGPYTDHPVIFFDGCCLLCIRSVGFIIRHDRKQLFYFAPLQGETAKGLFENIQQEGNPEFIILSYQNRRYVASSAALQIARRLRFPVNLFYLFILIPVPVRDWLYRIIANKRYRWFGTQGSCYLPGPEHSSRFLE